MTIVIASGNSKKSAELKILLEQEGISTLLQTQLRVLPVAETGLTFVENAILKARNVCLKTNMPAVADDSGLEIYALDNRPGIYSSRFAGAAANDEANRTKVLQELRDISDDKRTARFQCVIVLMRSAVDPTPIICQGTWEGKIVTALACDDGFGYDPIFWVPDYNCTAAELSFAVKNQISHRAQAMKKLIMALKERDWIRKT